MKKVLGIFPVILALPLAFAGTGGVYTKNREETRYSIWQVMR